MKSTVNRREFFQTTTSALAGLSASAWLPQTGFSKEDSEGKGNQLYRIALSQYSLHRMIRQGKLDALDYPAFAADRFGIHEIDVWDGTFPKENVNSWIKELRNRADQAKQNIFLLMIGPVPTAIKTAKERRRIVTDRIPRLDQAKALGCRYVRIFVRANDKQPSEALDQARKVLRPLADEAARRDLKLVIEPGASKLSKKGEWLARLAKAVDHPHLRLMPDFGKFPPNDPYEGTQAMMPYTEVVSAKSHHFDKKGNETGFDYPRLMKIIVDAGFRGPVAIEYEGKELPEVQGVLATQRLLKRIRKDLAAGANP